MHAFHLVHVLCNVLLAKSIQIFYHMAFYYICICVFKGPLTHRRIHVTHPGEVSKGEGSLTAEIGPIIIMCFKKSDIAFNHEPTYLFQFFVVLLVVLKAESLSIWSYFIVNNYKTKTHMVLIDRSSVNNCYM